MSVVFVLVIVAIFMAGAFLVAFIWSVKNGQFDDTYTPSVRMLFDDPQKTESENTKPREITIDGKKKSGKEK